MDFNLLKLLIIRPGLSHIFIAELSKLFR